MFRSMFRVPLVLAAVLMTVACSDDTPTTPTPPTPPTVTETFSETLSRNSARTHPFLASASGAITAALTTLSPDSALRIGMALGTWNGSSCTLIVTNDSATQGSQVVGQITSAGGGAFCVRLYDVGNIGDPVSYTVTVTHP